MKKLLHKLLRDRRGISMTEVIVAMAVVTIVTAAAISVVLASIKFDAKYNDETTALSYCESVVECVRFAEDHENLSKTLELLDPEFTDGVDFKGYELEKGGSTIAVEITSDEENFEYEIYTVKCDGETIYTTKKYAYEEN